MSNQEIYNLYISPYIIRMIKLRDGQGMQHAWERSAQGDLIGKPGCCGGDVKIYLSKIG
jgi:hypothetical protein